MVLLTTASVLLDRTVQVRSRAARSSGCMNSIFEEFEWFECS